MAVTTRLAIMAVLGACVSSGAATSVTDVRMALAPSRPGDCALELANDSPTSPDFLEKWQLLGYVNVQGATADPYAVVTRDLVRPHACAMGGTAVALAITSQTTGAAPSGAMVFMVLRPHPSGDVHPAF